MNHFDLLSKVRAVARLSLVLLGMAVIVPTSQANADDESLQQAALPTAPTTETDSKIEAARSLDLDSSFLIRETDGWHSDADGFSPARQARMESCYLSAEGAYQAGVWEGGFGSETDDVSAFEIGVSDFYARQQRRSQLGKCFE